MIQLEHNRPITDILDSLKSECAVTIDLAGILIRKIVCACLAINAVSTFGNFGMHRVHDVYTSFKKEFPSFLSYSHILNKFSQIYRNSVFLSRDKFYFYVSTIRILKRRHLRKRERHLSSTKKKPDKSIILICHRYGNDASGLFVSVAPTFLPPFSHRHLFITPRQRSLVLNEFSSQPTRARNLRHRLSLWVIISAARLSGLN